MMDALTLYSSQLGAGIWITLELAFSVLFLGLAFGLLLAWLKTSSLFIVRVPVDFFTGIIRGIPEFLIILTIYLGLSTLAGNLGGSLEISPFVGGVTALTIVFAAFSSEVFRGAFAAVPRGQIEAAEAFGVSTLRRFFLIQLPQAWRICLPSINNLWQGVVKDTSLVSVIGLEDTLKKAQIAAQYTRQPLLFYCAAGAIYFMILMLSIPLFRYLERRASRGFERG